MHALFVHTLLVGCLEVIVLGGMCLEPSNNNNKILHRLADRFSSKWEKPYSLMMGWIHARLSFAILWATMICVHGSRMMWRSLGISDGVSIFETV